MESNKQEAEKAMAIAENKFKANDVEGAKKFALEAKALFPSLPGLPQAIVAYEVHIAGEKRNRGDTHWCYAVLGVDPSDDFQAIKRRYKKLCVQIHPDKNRSAAADGAFKLVKEAWDMISEGYAKARSGGASTSPNTSHAFGGGNNAYGSSNTAYPAYAAQVYAFGGGNNAYGSSNTAYGPNSYHNYYQYNYYYTYFIHQCNFWF